MFRRVVAGTCKQIARILSCVTLDTQLWIMYGNAKLESTTRTGEHACVNRSNMYVFERERYKRHTLVAHDNNFACTAMHTKSHRIGEFVFSIAATRKQTLDRIEFSFLILWASSMMMYRQWNFLK